MNFLAHLYLSNNDPLIMIGNFIGDFVKGKNLKDKYEPALVKGIELHRSIDFYTDNHEVVQKSKNRLRPKYRHYSGVIVDVFYDHFLAKNWNVYHPVPLEKFAEDAYNLIITYDRSLPEEVKQIMPYMMKGNWLVNYSQTEGINRALTGMSRRTPYESKMNEATADLEENYLEFKNEFDVFFPMLDSHCKEWIKSH